MSLKQFQLRLLQKYSYCVLILPVQPWNNTVLDQEVYKFIFIQEKHFDFFFSFLVENLFNSIVIQTSSRGKLTLITGQVHQWTSRQQIHVSTQMGLDRWRFLTGQLMSLGTGEFKSCGWKAGSSTAQHCTLGEWLTPLIQTLASNH